MRVALVIASLEAGGAERVIADLAGRLADCHDVTLITLGPTGTDFYPIDPRVTRVGLDRLGVSASPLRAASRLVRTVSVLRAALGAVEPDVVVSFVDRTNVVTLLAAHRRWPVIVSERTDPRRYRPGRAWSALRRVTYPLAARVVVQTDSVRQWALQIVSPERVMVIPNSVNVVPVRRHESGRRQWVAMMGRLEPVKRFDLGIQAFARASQSVDGWSLVIIGEGSLRPEVRVQALALGIADKVLDIGRVRDTARILGQSAIFLLASDYEGFPNALLEAMACGCAVIATDCPSGPREIVRDGVDGVLVPVGDAAPMADALIRLMRDASERESVGARATEVLERFEPQRVMALWDQCLLTAARMRG